MSHHEFFEDVIHESFFTFTAGAKEILPSIEAAAFNLIHRVAPIHALVYASQRFCNYEVYFSNSFIRTQFKNGNVHKWFQRDFKYRSGNARLENGNKWHMLHTLLTELGVGVCYNPIADLEFASFYSGLQADVEERRATLRKIQQPKLRSKKK